jgi:undecaprenyl-diphosphatase
MTAIQAIVLGVVQGLSEFLPISSSGHLALARWFFGWEDIFAGDPTLETSFDVAVHLGTLTGAVAYFRKDLWRYATAGIGDVVHRDRPLSTDGRVAWLLVLSALPAAVIGSVLESVWGDRGQQIWLIAVMLIVFGFVLLWADRQNGTRTIDQWRPRDAVLMGFGQSLALQPGVSRAGATITVGLFLKLRRDEAARISFLMAVPVIAGAGLYQGVKLMDEGGIPSEYISPFLWGLAASAVTGWLAVWGTLKIVKTRTFLPFVIYRVGLGVLVLVLLAAGFRS